jgi:type I restriction enzyme M protein
VLVLDAQRQQAIRGALWRTFDVIRGGMDVGAFRDHLLALLVLKYLSDRGHDIRRQGNGIHVRPNQDLGKASLFDTLLDARYNEDIGKCLDQALAELEVWNPSLQGAFQGVSFDSSALGNPEQRKRILSELLVCFNAAEFDYRGVDEGAAESVAFACEALISEVASTSGKRGGEFFTPPEVSRLIARLIQPESGESVCDPCCGSGTLLLTCSAVARECPGQDGCHLYGQEKNGSTWALAKINMLVHGERVAQLEWGDTLKDPRLVVDGCLRKFDVVVSSPPFNLKEWGQEAAVHDPYGRYWRGIPPRGAADYAFISHMVETLNPGNGRMAVVVSHGVLFRSGAEQQIRKQLLQENLVDAVIGLPAKMLPNTAIPVALLVLRKKKHDTRVLFIDGSRDYEHGKTQNTLRQADIALIEGSYLARRDVDGYARVVSLDEILGNDGNLSVARYVDATEEVEPIDLAALRAERAQLKAELEALESKFANLLQEVDHG